METFNSIDDAWVSLMSNLGDAEEHDSRAGPTREVVGWSGRLADSTRNVLLHPARAMDPAYACAELLWYLSGERSVEMMCAYAPSYKRFANPQTEQGHAMGAYGHRWTSNPGFANQAVEVVENLDGVTMESQLDAAAILMEKRPETRQAVVTMWDSSDIGEAIVGQANDIPCTIALQFLPRRGKLHAHCYMRSNDAWLGFPYDVFCFTTIQRIMARRLGLQPGSYCHSVGSMHVYEKDRKKLLGGGLLRSLPEGSGSLRHGYDNDSGTWDVAAALRREKQARDAVNGGPKLAGVFMASGDPLADAAEVCCARLTGRAPTPHGLSPLLMRAWDTKEADKVTTARKKEH